MNLASLPRTQLEAIRFFADSGNCHAFLADMRWPDGVRCAHCSSAAAGKLVCSVAPSRSKHGRPPIVRRLWNCGACRRQFTVKTGTIFEDSPLGLELWLPALWLICNAKNGISSCELSRSLGVTQKSAWFMGHRIRLAMREGSFEVAGEVEADSAYIGGLAKNMNKRRRARVVKGPGGPASGKTEVHAVLQRSGVRGASRVAVDVAEVGQAGSPAQRHVCRVVRPGATLYTDSARAYPPIAGAYRHEFIDHALSYVEGRVHTNGLENFWSLLKRTVRGTYVAVSPCHLHRYLDEQATRFNERSDDDLGRFLSTVNRVSGRRLPYAGLTGIGVV